MYLTVFEILHMQFLGLRDVLEVVLLSLSEIGNHIISSSTVATVHQLRVLFF